MNSSCMMLSGRGSAQLGLGVGALQLVAGGHHGQPGDHAVHIEAVRPVGAGGGFRVGDVELFLECQRHEVHAGGVEVLIRPAVGVHAVEPAHHIAIHHIDHRLAHGLLKPLDAGHAFLNQHFADFHPFLDHAHFVAGLAVEVFHLAGVAHGHHAHAVGARVGLDDDKGLLLNAVFLVLLAHLGQHAVDRFGQTVFAVALVEVDLAALGEVGVEHPRIDADELGEFFRHIVIRVEVLGLAPHGPAGMQRWQQVLLMQTLQDGRDAARQIVVEQDGAGVEVFQPEAQFVADQRLHHQLAARRQLEVHGFGDRLVERPETHIQPGLAEDAHQGVDVFEVEGVAGVVLGNHQQVLGLRADFLDGGHGGLHRQRHHLRGEIVEAAGIEIGVDRRELEAGVAQIDRAVERRGVLHPFEAEPALDGGLRLQDALFEFEDGIARGGDEMRDHCSVCKSGDSPDSCRRSANALSSRICPGSGAVRHPAPALKNRRALRALQKGDELLRGGQLFAACGRGDAGVAVDAVRLFHRHLFGQLGVGDLPDIPDQPGVDIGLVDPGLAGQRAVGWIGDDVLAQRAHGADVAQATGGVFPDPVLSGAVDHEHLDAGLEQIGEAGDVLGVARAHQNGERPQVERSDVGTVELAVHGGDEVAHHGFRSGIDQVGVGPGGVDPLRGGAGGDFDLDARGFLEGRGRFLHGGRRAARAVHLERRGVVRQGQRRGRGQQQTSAQQAGAQQGAASGVGGLGSGRVG